MIKVFNEGYKVIIDLCARKYDVLLSVDDAEKLAEALEKHAATAALEPPELVKGEQWNARVESYDGLVAIRFFPPTIGAVNKVPLPATAAEKMASVIRDKASWAKHKMRLVISKE